MKWFRRKKKHKKTQQKTINPGFADLQSIFEHGGKHEVSQITLGREAYENLKRSGEIK